MKNFKTCYLLAGLIISLICLPLNAASLAAHVILVKGQVTATTTDGTIRSLKRRSKVFSGDIIKTGNTASVQLRFVDKALMTIKAASEMNISNYQMAQAGSGQSEEVFMKLVKGGFRTITGSIGKGEKSAYKVDTPAASIGIRGTNYEVQQEVGGGFVMAVYSGGISVKNESGTIDLGLGSDFNFTRVSKDSAPKGLLAAPKTLSENAATEASEDEEQEETAATEEEAAETEGEEVAAEDDSDAADEDSDEKTQVASSDSGGSDNKEGGEGETATESEVVSAIQTELTDLDEGTAEVLGDVIAAMDSKLTDELKESSETMKADVEQELVDAGYLEEGESLSDLADDIKDNIKNLGNFDDLKDALADEDIDLSIAGSIPDPEPDTTTPIIPPDTTQICSTGLFCFDDPYLGLTSVTNFIPVTELTDDENNLAASQTLALMAMPMDYTLDSNGRPLFSSTEAQLSSAVAQTAAEFTAYDYSLAGNSTSINLSYELLNTSTGLTQKYEVHIPIEEYIDSTTYLSFAIQNALFETATFYIDDNQVPTASASLHMQLLLVDSDTRFVFQADSGSNEYITQMELQFDETSEAGQALMAQLGSDNSGQDQWRSEVSIDLMIADGSWDKNSNTPIFILQETEEDQDGQIYDRTEIIRKNANAAQTVSSLAGLAACAQNNTICDIQKDDVAASSNIRWGAWLADPDDPINIYEINEDQDGFTNSNSRSDDSVLAFWVAAERADINQLTGTASFASGSHTDCRDFGQCIGFADDGAVHSLTGQFDVNFDTGAVSGGQLTIKTAGSDVTKPDPVILSTWNVNFAGQITGHGTANHKAEFQSDSVNGSITNSAGGLISDKVIGNVGGIFVKPGSVFAGGYNLGTADDTNKHAAGVFSLESTP